MGIYGIPILVPGSIEANRNQQGERTSKRDYRCYCDPLDSETTVLDALPVGLALYTTDPGYRGFIVTDVSVNDDPELTVWPSTDGGDDETPARVWVASITYGPWTAQLNSATGNPVDRPPRFRFACTRGVRIANQDINDNPIVNSAGDFYDPPIEADTTLIVLVVTRNEAQVDFPVVLGWCDHVNEDAWNGFGPRTLKVAPINLPDREYSQESDQLYYPMEYQLEYNPDTWDKKILDQGTREFDTNASGTNVSVQNPDGSTSFVTVYPLKNVLVEGQPAQEGVPLDGAGHALKPPINKASVKFNTVQVYPTLNFGVLGLDNLFDGNNAPPPSPSG